MAGKTYRVGVVGLTGIAANRISADPQAILNTPMPGSHVASYAALPHTSLEAVCELKTELFDQFKERWGDVLPDVRTYTDYRDMLEKENLDILSVVTSDNRHTDIVVDAANTGVKGIICEKPLATTVDDCKRMIAACAENGVPLSVEHTRRWRPGYHRARQAIRDGEIGGVRRIVGHMGGPRAMLFRNGTHLIDGVCFFAESEPEWVFAELDEGFEDYFIYRGDGGRSPEGDPGGSGYIHFKNGVRAFINGSKGQAGGFRIEVIGETARLDVESDAVTLWNALGQCQRLNSSPHMKEGITACIEELIRVMEAGGELLSPGPAGKRVVEIIVGFLKSQERGNVRVDLPLPPGN
ncbi:MAG: Gfo/Idh/MocA family oxidoreductase [Candidatus Poribacteria bacterium]|nr:Gfo/Idh/MocA family oxidoreductase [Candidatus Poribacteria bacterium]